MRRSPFVAAALFAIFCGAAHAEPEWGESPSDTQAADPESPTRTPQPEVPRTRFRAPPPPPRRPDLPLSQQTAVYVTTGLGTPVGFFGVEAVRRFGSYFELAGGLGIGDSTPNAPISRSWQWSLMPRVRYGRTDYNSVTVGAGVSGGRYGGVHVCFPFCDEDSGDSHYETTYTLWTNLEIGGEHWTRGGFAIRYFVGYAFGAPVGSQVAAANNALSPLSFPYTGVGIGYAF